MSESFEHKHDVLSIVSEPDDFATAVYLPRNGHNIDESWVIEYMCELGSEHSFSNTIMCVLGNRSDVRG